MPISSIQSLFDVNRIANQHDFPKVLLYFPFGFALLFLRLAVIVISWPILALLPKDYRLRSILLKCMRFLFGIFIKKDLQNRDEGVKLVVCNHISILDHIAVESVLSCIQVNVCSHFCSEWNFPAIYSSPHNSDMSRNKLSLLQHYINVCNMPVLVFPECGTTNGKYGLMKFTTSPFGMTPLIQPVVIQITRTSFLNISPSVIGTSEWCDLFWLLFVPCTFFSMRILPPMSQLDKESPEDFSLRVQNVMAYALNIISTECTSSDKKEYERRLIMAQPELPHAVMLQREQIQLSRMTDQVKDVLPNVPKTVILQDLRLTKNVDDTIYRLIEGIVQFVPENNSASTSSEISTSEAVATASFKDTNFSFGVWKKQTLPSLSTAAGEFGKTPRDRMLSYQDRKRILMESARMRYLRKHSST